MYQGDTAATRQTRAQSLWLQSQTLKLGRHWLAWANGFWGLITGLPWLAPLLVKAGATKAARTIYFLYGFLCHQLADRSFFAFGPKWMYAYTELVAYAPNAATWRGLKMFIGTPELGYKVAWSDRMVSLYGGIFVGGLVYALLRRWFKPRWTLLALMIVPVAVDGVAHSISDLSGVGVGFRYRNEWLATLTGGALPASFYVGNALGSFNSWMRLTTGLLAGLAIAWTLYRLLDSVLQGVRSEPRDRSWRTESKRASDLQASR